MQSFPKIKYSKSKDLVGTLDEVFSRYIRIRDSDPLDGNCKCCTCGKVMPWKSMDAGHFVQRDRKATRYNDHNVHAQCPHCNRFRGGEQFKHGEYIDRVHGKGTASMLQYLGKTYCKLDYDWLQWYIRHYRVKVKMLMKEKNIHE